MERNSRSKKPHLSFQEYCKMLEELLLLTGRKIQPKIITSTDGFKL